MLAEQCQVRLRVTSEWLGGGTDAPLSRDAFHEQFLSHKDYYLMAHSG